MSAAEDLSGRWQGIYNYPDGHVAVAFTADLIDGGDKLGGSITENDAHTDGRALLAQIDGARSGSMVTFTKFYEDADPEGYDAVAYSGTVSGDGDEISGEWTIPGVWSGSFIMTRPSSASVNSTIEVEQPIY